MYWYTLFISDIREFYRRFLPTIPCEIWNGHVELIKLDRLGKDVTLASSLQYKLDKDQMKVAMSLK